jgi:hypothetical protein
LLVENGTLVQQFDRISAVNPVADGAKVAPSSEVKHWALANVVPAWTVTWPLGWMSRRPGAELQRVYRDVDVRHRRHRGRQGEGDSVRAVCNRPLQVHDAADDHGRRVARSEGRGLPSQRMVRPSASTTFTVPRGRSPRPATAASMGAAAWRRPPPRSGAGRGLNDDRLDGGLGLVGLDGNGDHQVAVGAGVREAPLTEKVDPIISRRLTPRRLVRLSPAKMAAITEAG